ncbi:MAG TPA: glycosyl hydrolase [Tepidisphaeraceae bacterium]|jgi:hypothetical protein
MKSTWTALTLAAVFSITTVSLAAEMDDAFNAPPDLAKPRTWWHWVSGNVSREGITADLEAMKRVGVGGAQMFNVDQSDVKGPVVYGSDPWRGLVKHAIAECNRLGIELTMHNCEGWSESGGPWITPELSMQKVVWTEEEVDGGQKVDLTLRQPEKVRNYYKDIAVLAFPSLAGETKNLSPRFTSSGGDVDGAKLSDNDPTTRVTIKANDKGDAFLQVDFASAPQLSSVVISPISSYVKGDVEISEDGKSFKKVGAFSTGKREKGRQLFTFPNATVRALRLHVPKLDADKGWTLGEIEVGGTRIPDYIAKTGMQPKVEDNPFAKLASIPGEKIVDPARVIDLTKQMDAGGRLSWDAPAGNWTIVRLGHTSTGKENHPTMERSRGLECDKMSVAAVQKNWDGQMGVVIKDSKELAGKGLHMVLVDSWEAGCQNWTPKMAEAFKTRRGYDLGAWLVALTGRYVQSVENTERFLWDYRRTIADLIAEHHFGLMQKLCHDNKLQLTGEAVGIGMPTIADQLQCKSFTDVPMGEFWVDRHWNNADTKEAASAAHIFGTNIAAAEAFTAQPQAAGWKNDPYSLKILGDRIFCDGINRYVFHRYAHQPDERAPGMTMGPWGINFERTNTWWEPGSAWLKYIARCEHMLQRGRFVADVLYFYGEGAPVTLRIDALKPAPVAGYDYDACDAQTLLNSASVKDGMVTLASGMTYRILVLPNTNRMTPAVAQKVRDLINAGATVVGQKIVASPSLTSAPAADDLVKAVGEEVWANVDGKDVTQRTVGKGKIIWGKTIDEILKNVGKDFQVAEAPKDVNVRYIHRRDGDADIYFICNQKEKDDSVLASFRVSGKRPEIWNPVTGEITDDPVYTEEKGRTLVPLRFEPAGSTFVVFRKPRAASSLVSITRDGESIFKVIREKGAPQQLEITSAIYGVLNQPDKQKNVTDKLKSLMTDDRIETVLANDTLGGDPAPLVPKQFKIDYVLNGQKQSKTLNEGQTLSLPEDFTLKSELPAAQVAVIGGRTMLTAWKPGRYDITSSGGQHQKFNIAKRPNAITLTGPWNITFQEKRGAPASARFDKLVSWTEHDEPGIKYFSGTATYEKQLDIPAELLDKSGELALDLGVVKNLAQVIVNDQDLGVVWKPPFRVPVTKALKPGANKIQIKITNLWPNRLIGDQNLPEKERVTWTAYNPYKKDSQLLDSGLLGPVQIQVGEMVELNP